MVDLVDLETRMDSTVENFQTKLSGLRTGRASTGLVDNLKVEVYGSMMPLNQLASVNLPESRTISISVWDQGNVDSVVKAINTSDLGLNPNAEGNVIRINLPDLTEERRKELVKVANGYAEDARIAVRNIRRDGNDSAKRAKNDGELTEDDVHRYGDDIQKLTDDHIKKIDAALEGKEKDIMTV